MTRRPDCERRQRVVVDGRTVAEIRTECPDPVALCRAEMAKRGRTPITRLDAKDRVFPGPTVGYRDRIGFRASMHAGDTVGEATGYRRHAPPCP